MADTSRWLRLSVDWSKSEWLFVLSAESRLAWIELLCYAKVYGTKGVFPKKTALVLSRMFFVGEESVTQMIYAAKQAGALIESGDSWSLPSWEKYQGSDPTNATRQARYRNHKHKRDEVFSRDGWKCVLCGADTDLVVDHVVPVSKGGDTTVSNLQTLCRPCNAGKKDRITPVTRYERNGNGDTVRATETETETETETRDTPPTPLPGELVCIPGFVETWADWERHRSEKRQRLTPTARSRQLAMLVRQPDPVACLNQSIQNGWTGLFEVKAEPGRADHDPYAGVPRAGAS